MKLYKGIQANFETSFLKSMRENVGTTVDRDLLWTLMDHFDQIDSLSKPVIRQILTDESLQ